MRLEGTMLTRRKLLTDGLAIGAGLALPATNNATAQTPDPALERNKAVVRRFKEAQGTKQEADAIREVLSPDYKRRRGGIEHLAANARDQGFPGPGSYLRGAFPDRTDTIEDIIADGDRVGMLFRVRGTHRGNFFGIPPTDKPIDIHELGLFRLADGKITEAWFMADELGLLQQLGAKIPTRKDGQRIVPPVTGGGEDADQLVARWSATSYLPPGLDSMKLRQHRIMVVSSKGSAPAASDRAADFKQTRVGFQHLRDYGNAHGVGSETITAALPDRRDRVDDVLAEGDKVWMRFRVAGTHGGRLYGLAPTGKRVEVPEVGIFRFADGKWKESWYFADELGLLLQLGAVDKILS
jgi:predicted ester cyclase